MSPIADFPYAADELSAFTYSINTFIISLKNKQVVKYTSSDPAEFRTWLEENKVRNVNYTSPEVQIEEKVCRLSFEWFRQLVLLFVLPIREMVKDSFLKMLLPKMD